MSTIKKLSKLAAIATLGFMASTSFADPTVIDFTGSAPSNFSSVQIGDYIFTTDYGNTFINNDPDIVEAGDIKLLAMGAPTSVTMSQVGGGAFSLLGLDVGGSYVNMGHLWADAVSITAGAANWMADLTDNVSSYHYQDLSADSGFANITSVNFTGIGGGYEFTLDNINVIASVIANSPNAGVPEPGTFGILAASLIGLGLIRRRKIA